MPNVIYGEAFNKMCEVLNKVHQVRCTDCDPHVLVVQWSYRTICKSMTLKKIPRKWNEVRTIISKGHLKMNPHVIEPTGVTVCKAQDEEITQLWEVEHITLQEALRQGNFQLHKL